MKSPTKHLQVAPSATISSPTHLQSAQRLDFTEDVAFEPVECGGSSFDLPSTSSAPNESPAILLARIQELEDATS